MKWTFALTAAAERDMERIDRQDARRVIEALNRMAADREANENQPLPGTTKKLHGRKGQGRRRVGKIRIVFELERVTADPKAGRPEQEGLIVVLQVEGRDQVYKKK